MAEVTRVHGTVLAGAFYGYAPLFVLVEGVNVGVTGIDGNFERAVRALQTVAATVIIGTPTANEFMVVVDGNTANLDAVEEAVEAATGLAVTVTSATDLGTTLPS